MPEVIRKAQPDFGDVHIDRPLTNISIAYIQSAEDFVADKVFPVIGVNKQSDKYYTYDKNDWFRDEVQRRAASTESAGGGYDLSTDSYSCDVFAFHKDIDNRVMNNYDNPLSPKRDAVQFITQKFLLKKDILFASEFLTTSVWDNDKEGGASGGGKDFVQWDDYTNSDPIGDMITYVRLIKGKTGYKPNVLLLGEEVWNKIKNHPDIVDRIKYTRNGFDIGKQIVAQALGVDRIIVAGAIKATNNEGATGAYSDIVGKKGLLLYVPSSPSILTPSAGYTFAWKGIGGNGTGVAMDSFYMKPIKSTRVEGEMAFDQKKVAGDLGVYLYSMIS